MFSALVGAALACATLGAGVYFVDHPEGRAAIRSIPWIGWHQTGLAMLGVAAVGLVLSVIPTLVTTRKYLRV